jgi:hypothetical protein
VHIENIARIGFASGRPARRRSEISR